MKRAYGWTVIGACLGAYAGFLVVLVATALRT